MQIRLFLISIFTVLLLTNCRNHSAKLLKSEKVVMDGSEILYGSINKPQLYFDYPSWKTVEQAYKPDDDILQMLKQKMFPVKVDIFLGTWCSDSKREVPAFFKIIKTAGIEDKIDLSLWAVDRNKHLDSGLAEKKDINFVPTFVFYKDDSEIGRIIETPEGLLEEDMLKIVQNGSE